MADTPTNQGENHVQQVRPEVATVGGRQPLESDWHYSSAHIAHVLGDSARPIEGDFQGDNNALVSNIVALLGLDKDGALVPHGIGGHARCLLAAAAIRLSATSSPPVAAPPATPVAPWPFREQWPQPQPAQPLTDEQIVMDGLMMVPNNVCGDMPTVFEAGVRFAERWHGITAPSTPTPPHGVQE